MCSTFPGHASYNFCKSFTEQIVHIQQCNPIYQPCPSDALTYFTNSTSLVINGSSTVVNTSADCTMLVVFGQGGSTVNVTVDAGRSFTIFLEDFNSVTIECQADTTPMPGVFCTGNLLLDLHYCVKCSN